MRTTIRIAALGLSALVAGHVAAADAPTLVSAKDLKWIEVGVPAGARQAALWGDPASSDHGELLRWKTNSKAPSVVRSLEVHIVVLTGTLTVKLDGESREFGPGGFVSIPKGMKHALGCEASGECKFFMHHPGAVEVTKGK